MLYDHFSCYIVHTDDCSYPLECDDCLLHGDCGVCSSYVLEHPEDCIDCIYNYPDRSEKNDSVVQRNARKR